jgi:5-formyltetrahydrofolate cyclo-ligase
MGDWSGVRQAVDEKSREDDEGASVREQKRRIRSSILALRRELPEPERVARSRRVWERLTALSCYQHASVILGYMAFDKEVLTDGLLRQAMASGKQVVLPVVQADRLRLALYAVRNLERDVVPGYRGILEPRPLYTHPVALAELELVLVPGVAFDLWGVRLGFGIGYYDRLLGELPQGIPTVGLAFDFQVVPRLPRQPHDIALDAIVIESRVIRCPPPSGGDGTAMMARSTPVDGGWGEV